jgi:anaerobic C4-dicarboxylate transporter DcuA
MVWIDLCVLLACILVGARLGGIGLDTVAGLGLVVLVFIFGLPPGMPPRTVLRMIVRGDRRGNHAGRRRFEFLAAIADRALRVWPGGIRIVAPLVTFFVTFAAGTVHIVYALLPVIAEVSRKAGIRPERPLSIATIASQQAITASPISAATVASLALLTPQGIQLQQILLICVPSTLLGSLIGALAVLRKGPELEDDPIYKERLAQGLVSSDTSPVNLTGKELSRARGSVIVFLLAAVLVVVLGLFPSLRPSYTAVSGGQESVEQLDMAPAIMIMMFAAAGVNMLLFRASAAEPSRPAS